MKLKSICSISLMAVVTALLVTTMPAYATKMDDRIESSAKQSYVFKTYLKDDDINISSKHGLVILTGIVSEEYHKLLAQETLAGMPGVKSVDNRLELKGAPPTANSDAWIKDKVKITLLFHRSVSASGTEVDVKDGIVTLDGEATSQAQKELTAEYANDIEGVVAVNNEMTVASTPTKSRTVGEKIDDASIIAQVKMTLLFHRSTSALHTKVECKRGNVTVGGIAKNGAEKDLVSKLVSDVTGVKSVTNKMVIS
ncbi:MAG: BON domain-containing protein [Nitrospinae bacterium]|nr:BON domain-containing protein [Nitrospinota bacterium]MBF0634596.1 BON domain-containing protein [Nitrospinota bacterium]